MAKKYYWLKLKEDFFRQKEIKKLRKIAGGDTYTIIYLKLQLLSIKNDGIIEFEGTEEDIVEQLSLELDEDTENIKVTFAFLQANNLIEQINQNDYLISKVPESIGRESGAAERMRQMRQKRNNVTHKLQPVTKCYTEIEKEIEKDIEKDIEKEVEIENITTKVVCSNKLQPIIDKWNSLKLSKIIKIKGNRLKILNARIKEYGQDQVIEAIDNINYSVFLRGQNNRNWIITFDWFIKPNNFIKVLEQNYIDKRVENGDRKNTSKDKVEYDFNKEYKGPSYSNEDIDF